MNSKYIKKLLNCNRSGKVIKLMTDNVYNWSIDDYEKILKICTQYCYGYKKHWRVYYYIIIHIKKYKKDIITEHSYYKKINRTIDYWLYIISKMSELNFSLYENCINVIGVVKFCLNNTKFSSNIYCTIQKILRYDGNGYGIYNILISVVNYIFRPRNINIYFKDFQKVLNLIKEKHKIEMEKRHAYKITI